MNDTIKDRVAESLEKRRRTPGWNPFQAGTPYIPQDHALLMAEEVCRQMELDPDSAQDMADILEGAFLWAYDVGRYHEGCKFIDATRDTTAAPKVA